MNIYIEHVSKWTATVKFWTEKKRHPYFLVTFRSTTRKFPWHGTLCLLIGGLVSGRSLPAMLLPKKCQNLTPDSDDTKRQGGNTHVYQSKVYVMKGGGSLVTAIFGRLWPQFLVACDRMNCYGVTFRGRRNIWSCWSVTSRGKRIIWWCWRVNFSGRRSIWWNLAQYWSSAL